MVLYKKMKPFKAAEHKKRGRPGPMRSNTSANVHHAL